MPVAGPVSILIVHRGLHACYASGRWIAFGSALPEAAYAALAWWGIGELLDRHPIGGAVSRGLAAVVLLVTGVGVLRSARRGSRAPVRSRGASSFGMGFTISAINPTLLATWASAVAVLHGLGLPTPFTPAAAILFGIGVAVGITAWFLVLLALFARYRERLGPRLLAGLQWALGAIVLALGAFSGVRCLQALFGGAGRAS